MTTPPVLYVFHISHFAEKARWALDHKRVRYRAATLLPGPHWLTVRRFSRAAQVPLLLDDGAVIQGSSRIIDHAERVWPEPRLTPPGAADEVAALEQMLDRHVGEAARLVFYSYLLDRVDVTAPLFAAGGPRWGPAFYRVAYPAIARVIRSTYGVDRDRAERGKEIVAGAIARLEERLARCAYLVGDQLSRVDITAAALLAPIVAPTEHACRWDEVRAAVPGWAAWTARFDGSPVSAWVRRLYRDQRAT